jgi:SH3 domain protein
MLAFYLFISVSHMLSLPQASSQENDKVRYISDVLVINLKDRLESPFNIVTTVQSDDSVRVIEEKANYIKIETADGKQGWILKQYIKSDPPKDLIIKQLKQEVADLQNKLILKTGAPPEISSEKKMHSDAINKELQQKLFDAEKHIAELLQDRRGQPLSTEETSAASSSGSPTTPPFEETNSVEQNPENYNYTTLVSEFEKRGKQINDLQISIAKKNDHTGFLWFGAGAAVFFLGLLAGKINSRKKRKLSY